MCCAIWLFIGKFSRYGADMVTYDDLDRRILGELQRDAGRALEEVAEAVGLSRNAVWRRVRRLEEAGVLRGRVALVAPEAVGLGLLVFISVRTDRHDADWAAKFRAAVRSLPEVLGAFRTSGEQDYVIHARVADVQAYDRLYQRLIAKIELKDVSAAFVMEELKATTVLPV